MSKKEGPLQRLGRIGIEVPRLCHHNQTKEKSPVITITIGVDLAKHVFSICEVDERGSVRQRKELRRDGFSVWLAQVPAGTVVAMEACSGAHLGPPLS